MIPVASFINWAIVSGNTGSVFEIDTSGQISVLSNTNLDYETLNSYTLGIQVEDGVDTSAVETVTITVTDINDTAPVITAGQTFTISEDAGNGTDVATGAVAATDADTVGSLTNWAIVSGNTGSVFEIDSSGQISVLSNTNLDYETLNSYTLGIQVEDGVDTSAVETVTITVTDINDTAPVITAGQTFTISEDAANGTDVATGAVAATDADTVGSLTNWAIVSGNTGSVFEIDTSGQISVLSNTNLDYETLNSYTLGIQVEDGVNTSAVETVTITVTDVNDTAPVITAGQTFTISEDAANGTNVSTGAVLATDSDTVGGLVNWAIVSGNTGSVF